MSLHLYLMRHGEAEWGEPLDPTRELTSIGRKQVEDMAEFLVKQIGRVDLVVSSWMKRAVQTAAPMAEALGCHLVEHVSTLDPDGKPEDALSDIRNLAEIHGAEQVLVVGHHPLINDLLEMLCGAKSDDVHFGHAAIAHVDPDTTQLHWFIGPPQVEREETNIIEHAVKLCDAMLVEAGLHFDEKKGDQGSYYYDTHGVKRWVLGDGGKSGNCDLCEDNADAGWIDEDSTYPNADEPPQHPNCDCTEETKEKRYRVYV